MQRILNQAHSRETFLYSLSRMFERASYYGLRALIILYMIGEGLKMDRSEALTILGWFTIILVSSQVIGALLGDLYFGNRKSIIIGGILQALGAFSLCIPSSTGLYIGLALSALGGGLYTPNIIANFGKLYLHKTKLLDAAFTLFYLAVNLGSFLGILTIGLLGVENNWNLGFIIAGILMLLSVIPVLVLKEKKLDKTVRHELPIGKRALTVSIALILVGLFWAILKVVGIHLSDLHFEFSEIQKWGIPREIWVSISSYLLFPIGILAVIIWTSFYSSQFFKLMIGFILGAIGFGVLFLIPETSSEQHTIVYLISLVLLGISEIHIAPIGHSILTKYANPKYLAILISLSFIPIKLISLIFLLFDNRFYEDPILGLKFGIIAMAIIGIGLLILLYLRRKTNYNRVV